MFISTFTGHKFPYKLTIFTVTAAMIALTCLVAGAVFIVSNKRNQIKEKNLYHSGETIIISEANHFFTDTVKIIEDTSNPGDSEHTIHLYQFPLSCNSLPLTHTYHEFSYSNTSELPNMITYLVKGSTITVDICAMTNATKNTDRTVATKQLGFCQELKHTLWRAH